MIAFLYCGGQALAQSQENYSIRGLVMDAATGLPLPSANVFINNTMMGAATDSSGRFFIYNVPPGQFEIVASVIGYEVQKREIQIASEPEKELVFKLRPTILQTQEIEVTATDRKQWRKDFEKFTGILLSSTKNASETKILNPYVLEFSKTASGDFIATAQEPLIIENLALGYELEFILEQFLVSSNNLRLTGSTKFEELTPQSDKQLQQWQKNRLRAYRGSLHHFLATLSDTTGRLEVRLLREGFEVFSFQQSWEREVKGVAEHVNLQQYLSRGRLPHQLCLNFPDYLGVKFVKEREERNFLSYHQLQRDLSTQESWIKLEYGPLNLDPNGRYSNKAALMEFGYWAWERLADMLPYEYKP